MKDIRCLFGRHKSIHSIEEEGFLTEKCLRCEKVRVIDIEKTMEHLSKNYPEVVARFREIREEIREFRQLKKCKVVIE